MTLYMLVCAGILPGREGRGCSARRPTRRQIRWSPGAGEGGPEQGAGSLPAGVQGSHGGALWRSGERVQEQVRGGQL